MFSITQEKQCSISSRQVDGWMDGWMDGMGWDGMEWMDGWIDRICPQQN